MEDQDKFKRITISAGEVARNLLQILVTGNYPDGTEDLGLEIKWALQYQGTPREGESSKKNPDMSFPTKGIELSISVAAHELLPTIFGQLSSHGSFLEEYRALKKAVRNAETVTAFTLKESGWVWNDVAENEYWKAPKKKDAPKPKPDLPVPTGSASN